MKLYPLFFCIAVVFLYTQAGKLHDTVQEGCLEEVQQVVEQGCDINEQDEPGKTALYYACKKNDLDTVKYLYTMGARLTGLTTRNKNYGLLHIACLMGHTEVIFFLIQQGLNPSGLDICGKSPDELLCTATSKICVENRKKITMLFTNALKWHKRFSKRIAVDFFAQNLKISDDMSNLTLGFNLAFNQGIIKFFELLYWHLYDPEDGPGPLKWSEYWKQRTDRQEMFELLFGVLNKLSLERDYQKCLIKKARREKKSEFCAAAVDGGWFNAQQLVKQGFENFSSYQRNMLTKVILGKDMSLYGYYDLKLVHL